MVTMMRLAVLSLAVLARCEVYAFAPAPIRTFRSSGKSLPANKGAAAGIAGREDVERTKALLLQGGARGKQAEAAGGGGPGGAWDIELCSPSKINLFLRIVRRRDDGYHDLASLFQAIALSDSLKMSLLPEDYAGDDTFECDMEGVPVDRTNLVLRAVDTFRESTGLADRKFKIRLEKTVPAQAGLGGGSGNAATALWACNELCRANGLPTASIEELVEMSKGLGSDATFFLSQGTAYCTGRGEVMTPLTDLPPADLVIVKPQVGLSTPAVFKALDLDGRSDADPLGLLGLHTTAADGDDKYVNDLEKPAFSVVPELAALKAHLQGTLGFPIVSMSGSGTSVFAMGAPANHAGDVDWAAELEADAAAGKFPWPVKVFKTSFLNREAGVWYDAK